MTRHISDIDENVRKVVKEAGPKDLAHLILCMLDMMQGVSITCPNENDQYLADLGMELATWKRAIV